MLSDLGRSLIDILGSTKYFFRSNHATNLVSSPYARCVAPFGDTSQVARCTKIIDAGSDDAKYVINVKQIAKFVVGLGEKVAPTDVEESMRVGVDRTKYSIQLPLPPKIDPSVSLMQVEDKPDVTYDNVGGAKDALEKLREVVELPLLHPERFLTLGIDPPKGVLLYGPPGTGKTLSARAVANRTDACFIRVIGSELVQKYVGEGARMVRELFTMARSKKACIVFFDEVGHSRIHIILPQRKNSEIMTFLSFRCV